MLFLIANPQKLKGEFLKNESPDEPKIHLGGRTSKGAKILLKFRFGWSRTLQRQFFRLFGGHASGVPNFSVRQEPRPPMFRSSDFI